jgi:rod shape-determining protein MreB
MSMEVRGYDLVASLPRKVNVSSEEIREALRGPVGEVVGAIKRVLDKTPPELSGDLVDAGMTLAGGGALLRGIDKVIAQETGLPVRIADDPMTCVVRGTGIVLENPEIMKVLETGASDD